MNNKKYVHVLLSLLVALFTLMSVSVMAQDDTLQTVTIASTEDGLEVPETVSAGWTEITFENTSEIPFYSIIARLDDEATMDEFMGALMGMMMGESTDAPPATLLGSPMALPGVTQSAMYNLEAGNYVLLSVAGEMPDVASFTVEGEMSENELEIEPDLTVALADFIFGLPSELEAGEQIWAIDNVGEQQHEMVFIQVPDGSTMEDAMMMLMPQEAEAEAMADGEAEDDAEAEGEEMAEEGSPFDGLSYLWSPMDSGQNGLTRVDLAPGTYLVVCFIPDSTSEEGLSHAEQGMMQIVTVVEAEDE